jgi:hypothetical protein
LATTTEPSLIRGTIRLPAARIGWRGCACGIVGSLVAATGVGLLLGTGLNEAAMSGLLAGLCVALGVVFGVGLIAAAGSMDPFRAAMMTLLSTVVLMFVAIGVGFAVQIAMEPAAGPFWLAIAGGSAAAVWAEIVTTLPRLGTVDEGL